MPASPPQRWDREVDVIVLGSGAAGLAAATLAHDGGAKVLLLEKAALFGGTTAVSGGLAWVPLNRHMAALGLADSRDETLRYLRRLALDRAPDDSLLETYVDTAREMIEYFEKHTPARFYAPRDYADYYAFLPGGLPHGRSLDNCPFDAASLGQWAERLRRSHTFPPLTVEERGAPDFELMGQRYEQDIRTMGSALVASLFKGLLDRGVETLHDTRASELIMDGDGAAIGVRAQRQGVAFYAGARRGVVLACGDFEWNRELMRAFLPLEITHSLTPPSNEGDGLLMAMDAGALLGNMGEAWWMPASSDPTEEYDGRRLSKFAPGRGAPASMMVNRYGHRFASESTMYNDLPRAFAVFDPVRQEYPNLPCWNIFDHSVKSSAMLFTVMPEDPAPDWLPQAPTLRQLAATVGIDPDGLVAAVERFNTFAAEGVDPDFHRGRYSFGPSPEPKPAPLVTPPFYALPVHAGAIGTKGGPRINRHGQVLRATGGVIPGLYAAGNAAAGIFGQAYPGGGGTIGPALVFGYLAGKAAAQEQPRGQ